MGELFNLGEEKPNFDSKSKTVKENTKLYLKRKEPLLDKK